MAIDRSPTGLTIILHGCDGSVWHVHGDGAGREGVFCAKDQIKGLFDPPVRTAWASGARQIGGRMKGRWFDPRDLDLGFHLVADRVPGGDQETLMSQFWQAFDFREDDYDWDAVLPRIQVISKKSDRFLEVQLRENLDFNPSTDPLMRRHANPSLPLRAGMPFWQTEPEISPWSTGSTSGSGNVYVSNPSPLPMYQKWIVTRGTWTLPDRSWEGPRNARVLGVSKRTGMDHSARNILMPVIGPVQGGATVDLDPNELPVRDAHGTNLIGQMPVPGMYFEYEIPPHTQRTALPVSVTAAPSGGAMAQLVMPRWWPLPIGGQ